MTEFQKIIKALAIALGVFIIASIAMGIVRFGSLFLNFRFDGGKRVSGEITENLEGVTNLDISLEATNLEIEVGDKFKITRIDTSDNFHIINKNDGTLRIEESGITFWNSKAAGTLKVEIPTSSYLDSLDISMGAGKISIDGVEVPDFELEQGAGTVDISNCKFDKVKFEGGAGKIDIKSSTLNDLDLETGVGSANIEAYILGNSKIEVGVGSMNLTLLGGMDNYMVFAEKGIGSINVDGESYTSPVGTGLNKINIEGGVGSINVKFKTNTKEPAKPSEPIESSEQSEIEQL